MMETFGETPAGESCPERASHPSEPSLAWSGGFVPNRGELAVMYCFVFLYIAAHGAGTLSLDLIFGGKSKET